MDGNWSDIIRAAATADLGVLALLVLVIGALALVYFRKGPTSAQIFVLVGLFAGAIAFGGAILEERKERKAASAEVKSREKNVAPDAPAKTTVAVPDAPRPKSVDNAARPAEIVRQPANGAEPRAGELFIATGSASGVYYLVGAGVAALLSKHVPGMKAMAGTTGGSVANLQMLQRKRADIAFTTADASWHAYNAQQKFQDQPVPVRALVVLYPTRMHLVTLTGTGINQFTDLKGKRVSTGPPNGATESVALRLLEAYGMTPADLIQERLDGGKAAERIRDRKIDAYFWLGDVPIASITALAATPGVEIRLIDHDAGVDDLVKKYGALYAKGVIPAKSYPGQEQLSRTVTLWNIVVARADMPDDVAYEIVKTMFEHKDELVRVHREARNLNLNYQTTAAAAIPYHPGAVKYFTEKGLQFR